MTQIYLTGAVSDWEDPFAWQDALRESDEYEQDFVNPYLLNDFELGDDRVYEQPERVVEPALDAVEASDGLLVHWDDDAFLVGTSMEIQHAFNNDVPVVLWYDGYRDNLSPWLLHMTRGTFESKEKALDVLLGYADDGFTFS